VKDRVFFKKSPYLCHPHLEKSGFIPETILKSLQAKVFITYSKSANKVFFEFFFEIFVIKIKKFSTFALPKWGKTIFEEIGKAKK